MGVIILKDGTRFQAILGVSLEFNNVHGCVFRRIIINGLPASKFPDNVKELPYKAAVSDDQHFARLCLGLL